MPHSTQAEIVAKTNAITGAIAALVTNAAHDGLDTAKAAEALLTSTDYVSYAGVTSALAMAEVTNTQILAKTNAITGAIAALVFAGEADLAAAELVED
jgi:ABC-type uncharacterized transport system substrate-binding protein